MKNFLVIGGSSGIGKALTELLVSSGDNVFATYCNNDSFSASANYHFLDVRSETIDLSFLPETLDGLAFCPGSIDLKPFSRIKPADILADVDFQVNGAIRVIQSVLPKLKASGHASIVLFSTVAVQTGFPFHTQVAISKGAIEGLTKALAAEFAPGIRVNAIAPSITNTSLAGKLLNSPEKIEANGLRHPMKRVGEADDIAEAASFLLSERSSWITGQVLSVDGGMSTLKTT
jgi:NAD(P)-dependent dehydrogenase (short-subunit alcohol dehydrogenase family)